jgi:hypothetical protein
MYLTDIKIIIRKEEKEDAIHQCRHHHQKSLICSFIIHTIHTCVHVHTYNMI